MERNEKMLEDKTEKVEDTEKAEELCLTCCFYKPDIVDGEQSDLGECHRDPPIMLLCHTIPDSDGAPGTLEYEYDTRWPDVHSSDSCGRWRSKRGRRYRISRIENPPTPEAAGNVQ